MAAGPEEKSVVSHGAIVLAKRYLGDAAASWGLGAFGALGEFHHDLDEEGALTTTSTGGEFVTKRGGIRVALSPAVVVAPYQVPSKRRGLWSHGINFCLPETLAFRQRRTVLTELGYDRDALRRHDRDGILFDLGLGFGHVEVLIRVRDHRLLAKLGAMRGRIFLDPANPALGAVLDESPHRIFRSNLGRIEVYGKIPAPDDKTPPSGPHSHILPELLKHGRARAANVPIPDGMLPCLSLFPTNPILDSSGEPKPFDKTAHDAFQTILAQFGDPERVALVARVMDSVRDGKRPLDPADLDRFGRHAARVALRQYAALRKGSVSENLARWVERFEPSGGNPAV